MYEFKTISLHAVDKNQRWNSAITDIINFEDTSMAVVLHSFHVFQLLILLCDNGLSDMHFPWSSVFLPVLCFAYILHPAVIYII